MAEVSLIKYYGLSESDWTKDETGGFSGEISRYFESKGNSSSRWFGKIGLYEPLMEEGKIGLLCTYSSVIEADVFLNPISLGRAYSSNIIYLRNPLCTLYSLILRPSEKNPSFDPRLISLCESLQLKPESPKVSKEVLGYLEKYCLSPWIEDLIPFEDFSFNKKMSMETLN